MKYCIKDYMKDFSKKDLAKAALLTTLVAFKLNSKFNNSKPAIDIKPNPQHPNLNTNADAPYIGNGSVILTVEGLNDGSVVLPEINIPLKEHDTIIDLTVRALLNVNLPFNVTGIGRDSTITSINGISQKSEAVGYGWVYMVDGVFPTVSPALYYPSANENIEWVFISSDNDMYPDTAELFVKRENNLLNF
ncbi:MAG: hypothetical protein ATN33_07645 [Epulopiscium sp. Nele67-Bin001]|nr:MAG: hypothetical protein ATN33_07645 [Epulopiscium sp. Nele67-Bin001]